MLFSQSEIFFQLFPQFILYLGTWFVGVLQYFYQIEQMFGIFYYQMMQFVFNVAIKNGPWLRQILSMWIS